MRIGIVPDAYLLNLDALTDDTIQGIMRSIGDAGDTPDNSTGATLLDLNNSIHVALDALVNIITNALVLGDNINDMALPNGATLQIEVATHDYVPHTVINIGFEVTGVAEIGVVAQIGSALSTHIVHTTVGAERDMISEPYAGDIGEDIGVQIKNTSGGVISAYLGFRLGL